MILPRRITADWLEKQSACPFQLSEFRRLFPTGATITKKNIMRASRGKLDLDWFIYHVLGNVVCDGHDDKVKELSTETEWKEHEASVRKLERATILANPRGHV